MLSNWFVRVTPVAACVLLCAAPASAQLDLKLFGSDKSAVSSKSSRELDVSTALTPADAQPGDEVKLSLTVKLPESYYIYSTNAELFAGATRIEVETTGLEPLDAAFQADRDPKVIFEPAFGHNVEKFFKQVVWTRKYRVKTGAEPSDVNVSGTLSGQYCNDEKCLLIRPPHRFSAGLGETAGGPSQPVRYQMKTRPDRKGRPDHVELEFKLTPSDANPGDRVVLSITADLDEGWHTYSVTHEGLGAIATKIDVSDVRGLKPLDDAFKPTKPPAIEKPLDDLTLEVHHDKVTWQRAFEVLPVAESGGFGLKGQIAYQLCDEQKCLPVLTVPFALGQLGSAPMGAEPAGEPSPVAPAVPTGEPTARESAAARTAAPQGLAPFLMTAFVAGFLALLTPCVFPMVPITVSFFLKQSEKEHHRPLGMASIYCAGIVFAFTVLGLLMAAFFGATSLTELANNPWMNLVIAAVFIFFGLNLLGMFEIRVPGWLLTFTAGRESQGGVLGVLFMALTFTLTSFTCTFAFVGGLLVLAAQGDFYWPVLGMIAFSLAFALPFFFLALFPSYLQKLPKSGGWMNTVKVTMGMLEIGAAVKFLSVADNPNPIVFDYTMVMTSWLVLALCMGLYLLGLFRLPHDTRVEHISVQRLMFAMLFIGLAAFLGVGIFGPQEPGGKLWPQIASFAPMRSGQSGEGAIGPYREQGGLKYALDVDRAIEYAETEQQPLFLDFTGVNCVNCRLMEKIMERPQNHERIRKFVGVQLYTDRVPNIQDPELAAELLEKNRRLQENWFRDVTLPSYAVVTPDGEDVLAKFSGLEQQDGEFAAFLDAGLEAWQRRQAAASPPRLAER